ncbi:MAG: class I SAM-dependent methyltransferase [Rhodobacteraceae bacterium]|nr:class I SAM-dependent methyltransferase [Paracoccaceae bacterium]
MDGNEIGFSKGSFDAIVGHSVLHHIARFEDTLRACFNLLNDEGVCAFGEPVLDAHAFASLLAQNIKVCAQLSGDELSHEERMVLNAVAMRAGQKRRQLEGSRDALGAIEDKFQFPVDDMADLARQIGFSAFRFEPSNTAASLGDTSMRALRQVSAQVGISGDFLDRYQALADALTDVHADATRLAPQSLFGFFVFAK